MHDLFITEVNFDLTENAVTRFLLWPVECSFEINAY